MGSKFYEFYYTSWILCHMKQVSTFCRPVNPHDGDHLPLAAGKVPDITIFCCDRLVAVLTLTTV